MTAKAKQVRITEAEGVEILRYKMKDEGLLVVGQVGNTTGAGHRRTADALMIQTWPSRGLSITGVEYKADRNDWRRELRNGSKAEEIAVYCHYWLLLAPKDVIPIEEVPGGWGLYEIHKTEKMTKLLRTKPPPAKVDPPKPIDLGFLAAILRARENYQPDRAKVELEINRRDEIRRDRYEADLKLRSRNFERLKEKVDEFEKASGIEIRSGWGHERLGKGLREYLKDPDQFAKRLRRQREELRHVADAIDEVLES